MLGCDVIVGDIGLREGKTADRCLLLAIGSWRFHGMEWTERDERKLFAKMEGDIILSLMLNEKVTNGQNWSYGTANFPSVMVD